MPGGEKGGKPNPGFPPFPPPLEIAPRFPHSHRPDDDYRSQKKGTQPRIAPLPPSGSSFNEKMLSTLGYRSDDREGPQGWFRPEGQHG
jgi:hypothetical protein